MGGRQQQVDQVLAGIAVGQFQRSATMLPSPNSPGSPSTGKPRIERRAIHVFAALFESRRIGELGEADLAQRSGDAVAEDAHDLATFADAVAGQRADRRAILSRGRYLAPLRGESRYLGEVEIEDQRVERRNVIAADR